MRLNKQKCLFCAKDAMPSIQGEQNWFCEKCAELWQAKLKNLLQTEDGKDVINVILKISTILSTHFTGSSADTFNAGKRVIGTWLLKEIAYADKKTAGEVVLKYLSK